MQEREDDIGRTEYPSSAGLTFNHSFAHTPRLFCLKEPPLTSRRDKASIFLPYLCYLRAFGRYSPPSNHHRTSPRSSRRPIFSPPAPFFPPRGTPPSRHFIRRACLGLCSAFASPPKHLGYLHSHSIPREMHELLLYGQVPLERHDQALKILAGIAAMQPQTLFERHLIYKPMRLAQDYKPNKKFPNKPVKPQTLTFQHLVRQLDQSEFGKDSGILSEPEKIQDAIRPEYPWRITTQETPEPETKTIVLRQATDVALDNDQLRNFLDPTING
jgi:hypothetical protein